MVAVSDIRALAFLGGKLPSVIIFLEKMDIRSPSVVVINVWDAENFRQSLALGVATLDVG